MDNEIGLLYDKLFIGAKNLIQTGVKHYPTIFTVLDNGEIKILDVSGAQSNEAIFELHQRIASDINTRCTILAIEAWRLDIRGLNPNEETRMLALIRTHGMEFHPLKQEVLMFNFLTHTANGVAVCRILRPENYLIKGKIVPIRDSDRGHISQFIRD